MPNSIREAIIQTKIDGAMTEVYYRTGAEYVYVDETTTLAAKLTDILTGLAGKATTADVTTAVSTAIDNLIDGAPNTYDTLKEIADYISSHEEVTTALNSAIGNKVDKAEGYSLVADTLITKLTNLDAHTHSNKTVLDGITAADVAAWNGKSNIYIQETTPSNMQNGDLWIQLIPEESE